MNDSQAESRPLQAIQENQETSKEIRSRFSRFCDEVCTFNLDMERAYELAERKGRLVHDECARASTRLEALERELRTIAEKIAENDIAFSASLAHCLLHKHLPDVKAKAQLEAETTKQRKAVDKLQQERDRLFELDKSVDKIVNVLREFANNANALVNAWEAQIINQFSELDALLETVVCGEHVTSFFGTKLDITHDAYEKLKDMLYKYSRALAGRTRLSRLELSDLPE
ncbi:hypothetical protein BN946_scf184704.g7 [Trametes cinnabarina]|uniref:Uncharacterized protein n=1 Tax=Pycnoporus cinnabarinus TaxID=5643 RepID=A0A060S846_PYCCI|nr:hypothetical protein BN946_scf184704.g7 [Trametes cinnabarina]